MRDVIYGRLPTNAENAAAVASLAAARRPKRKDGRDVYSCIASVAFAACVVFVAVDGNQAETSLSSIYHAFAVGAYNKFITVLICRDEVQLVARQIIAAVFRPDKKV